MNKLGLTVHAEGKYLQLRLDIDGVYFHGLVNIHAVLSSLNQAGSSYYLLTCSCGEPGCANINDKIVQLIDYTTNIVYWYFPEESYGDDFNSKSFTFELNQFISEINKFKVDTRNLEKNGLRFTQFEFWKMSDEMPNVESDNNYDEMFCALDELEICAGNEYISSVSRKIILFNSVSSIRAGLKRIKMIYGLKQETYTYDTMYIVDILYNELMTRMANNLQFDPALYTRVIIYVNDSIKEGTFIEDNLFFDCDNGFTSKVLKNSVLASFNKIIKIGQDSINSINTVSSIKIIHHNEDQ